MMSNGRRVPRNGVPTPPRGPRPEGFRSYGADNDQMAAGPRADGAAPSGRLDGRGPNGPRSGRRRGQAGTPATPGPGRQWPTG